MSTPATVVISQSNGAGPAITDGIAGLSLGSADIANMVPADHPLVIPVSGSVNSYSTYTRWKVTAWVDTNTIANLKWFKSAGTIASGWVEYYANVTRSYVQPTRTTSATGVGAWPTTAGGAIAITGSMTNPTTGYNGGNYAVHQLQIGSTVVAGAKGSHTITYRYDES